MFTAEEIECLTKAAKKYAQERRDAGKPTSIIDGVITKLSAADYSVDAAKSCYRAVTEELGLAWNTPVNQIRRTIRGLMDALKKAREHLQSCESLSDSNDCPCGWIGEHAAKGLKEIDKVLS